MVERKELMGKAMMLVPLAVLLLMPISCAQAGIQLPDSKWIANTAVAIAAAYLIVAAAYMLAKAVSNTELVSWSHKELFQVTATLFIVFILFFTSVIEDYVVNMYVEGNIQTLDNYGYDKNHESQSAAFAMSQAYLDMVRWYLSKTLALSTITSLSVESTLSTMYFQQPFFGGLIVFSFEEVYNTMKKPVRDMNGKILGGLMLAWSVTAAQAWFLDMIRNIAFTLILPIGVILRTTPFMRNIGSTMIAIAIGLYLIFPLTYIVDYKILESMKGTDWTESGFKNNLERIGKGTTAGGLAIGLGSKLGSAWVDKIMEKGIGKGLGTVFDKIFGSDNDASQIPGKLARKTAWKDFSGASLFSLGKIGLALTNMMIAIPLMTSLAEDTAFALVVFAACLPILNITITFGITREIAQLLGTDITLDTLMEII